MGLVGNNHGQRTTIADPRVEKNTIAQSVLWQGKGLERKNVKETERLVTKYKWMSPAWLWWAKRPATS
ncbi:hypothetical protein BaRGS_00013860 [Batillaria attramentaria]|uniref:Uncharacterized protein n=1 Tax=Batillaria attramentaria TaxID=370345 RepID=A0ABD0L641_9CAEN